MTKGFQPAITISDALDKISSNSFLLPAIQRKFVWKPRQIELLFDSIMREYPINSLMLWEITCPKIKNEYKFYSFLRTYKQRYGEMNTVLDTRGKTDPFYAVIDGQQRLNSLYIGLKGTYASKLPNKRWIDNEINLPPLKLYIEIKKGYTPESDIDKEYNFKFLQKQQVEQMNKENFEFWFEVGDILKLPKAKDQYLFLRKIGLEENEYSSEILDKLSTIINKDKILTYYSEDEQDLDKVLDIFIRTNDGGTKLTFSDLLLSVLSATWPEAREKFDNLIHDVNQYGDFVINSDLILKILLMIFSKDIKSRVKNFNTMTVDNIIENWTEIRKTILNTFEMFYRMGFNESTFPAKSASIPIIFYIYMNDMSDNVIKNNFFNDSNINNKKIKKWLLLVFLKHIFSGQTDSILSNLKKIISENKGSEFPIEIIISNARGNATKNYSFDSEFIDGLFQTSYGSEDAYFVLALFYPNLDYFNQDFNIDHIHPRAKFIDENYIKSVFSEEELKEIDKGWNLLGNLELLNGEKNKSKNDKPLKKWAEENNISNDFFFVDNDISLDLKNFRDFYLNRINNMKNKLINIVK